MLFKVFFITSGTTFQIPSDFSTLSSIEAIGGGGGAYISNAGGGSGGGGYSKSTGVSGLVSGNTAYVSIGAGGAVGSSGGTTWFNATTNSAPTISSQGVLANGGSVASSATGGAGGSTTGAIGTTVYAGGSGGAVTGSKGNGGGGGAAGPGGAGGTGGAGTGTSATTVGNGGGGSGATLTLAGTTGASGTNSANGGNGGASTGQTGGTGATTSTIATTGTNGGGGGGGFGATNPYNYAANGSAGSIWTASAGGTAGPGGGSGGGTGAPVSGGLYGGGAGSSGVSTSTGGQGIIVFSYYSTTSANALYWVGGSGTWDTTTPTNWSLTSGGPGGAGIPDSTTNVYFDANSGSGTITLAAGPLYCQNFDATGSSFTFNSGSTPSLQIYGNFTLSSTSSWTGGKGTITTNANTTFTTNGVAINSNITANGGAGTTFTLGSALSCPGLAFTLTSGNLTLNGFNLSAGTFVSNNAVARTIAFGSNSITVTSFGNIWNVVGTSLTVTGTPTVNISNNSGNAVTIGNNVGFTANNTFNFNFTTGTYTLTASTPFITNNLDFTGFAGTWSPGAVTATIYGYLTMSSGMTFTAGSGVWTFASTSTGQTINSAGKSLGALTFNGVGGGWTLTSALTCTNLTFTTGSFNTGNYNINSGSWSYSGSGPASISLGSSTITASYNGTFWNFGITTTGLTFNAGTSTINGTASSGSNFNGGGLTYYNVSLTQTGAAYPTAIFGNNTFNNLTLNAYTNPGMQFYYIGADQVVNNLFTTTGSGAVKRLSVFSYNVGVPRKITAASVSLTDTDFQDIIGAGAATWSGTRLGNCAGNSNITFPAPKTVYWNLTGSQNWSATGWATSSGGTPSVTNFPLVQDTAIFNNAGSVTLVTIETLWNLGTIDMSARTASMTLAGLGVTGQGPISVYGNWLNGTGVTLNTAGTQPVNFVGRNAQSIKSNGVIWPTGGAIGILSIGGTVTLTDNLSFASATGSVTLTNGTLNLNNNTLSIGAFSSTGTTTRSIAFGTGNITITGLSTVWNMATATGFTYTGTPTVNISNSGSAALTVNPGTSGVTATNALNFNYTGGTYTLTIQTGSYSNSLNFTGFRGILAGGTVNLFGSLTYSLNMSSSATHNFVAVTPGQTITTAGIPMTAPNFNGIGGAWQLQDNFTSAGAFTLQNGSIDFNGKTVSCTSGSITGGTLGVNSGILSCSSTLTHTGGAITATTGNVSATTFASSGALRALNMGSGTWTFSGTGTVWNVLAVGCDFNPGTSTIVLSDNTTATKTFAGGGGIYNNLQLGPSVATANTSYTFTGQNNKFLGSINLSQPTQGVGSTLIFPSGSQVIANTWNVNGSSSNLVYLQSSTLGSQYGLNSPDPTGTNTINLSYVAIRDCGAGGALWVANNGTCTDLGNNFGIRFGSANTLYWVGGSGTWSSTSNTNWASTSGGAGGVSVPTANTNVIFDANSGTSPLITVSGTVFAGSIDTTNAQSPTLQGGQINCYGNIKLGSSTVMSSVSALSILTPGGIISTNGVLLPNTTINGYGVGATLANNLTMVTGNTISLLAGNLSLNNYSIYTGYFSSNNSIGRTIDFGNNGSITCNATTGTIWTTSLITGFSYYGNSAIYISNNTATTTIVGTGTPTIISQQAMNFNYNAGTYSLQDATAFYRNLNYTGFNGSLNTNGRTVYGNVIHSSTMGSTGAQPLTLSSLDTFSALTNTLYMVTNGISMNNSITISGYSNRTINDNLVMSPSSTFTISFTNTNSPGSTFNANNQSITTGLFSLTGSYPNIVMGSNTWSITGGPGSIWSVTATNPNFITNPNSTILLSNTVIRTVPGLYTFAAGTGKYNNLLIDNLGVNSNLTFTSAGATFNNISTTANTQQMNFSFAAGSTTTANNWNLGGTSNNTLMGLQSTVLGTNYTLVSNNSLTMNYVSIADAIVSPANTITVNNGYLFAENSNSSYSMNTINAAANTAYAVLLTTGTSWTVPLNFNPSLPNQVYLIGAGGGGGGGSASGSNYVGGGGGGGGGFTLLNNVLSANTTYSFTIGAGGTGGVAGTSSTAGNGGNTTFTLANTTTYYAYGGGGGSSNAISTPISTGGLGGIGLTYNGGPGGFGTKSTGSVNSGGGGGGGAAGPCGPGGRGGNNLVATGLNIGSSGGGNGGGSDGRNVSGTAVGTFSGSNINGVGSQLGNSGAGTSGFAGSGGGASQNSNAGNGGNGVDIANLFGSGGGAAPISGGANSTMTAGLYGGGGSAGPWNGSPRNGNVGAQGAIVIIYNGTFTPPKILNNGQFWSLF